MVPEVRSGCLWAPEVPLQNAHILGGEKDESHSFHALLLAHLNKWPENELIKGFWTLEAMEMISKKNPCHFAESLGPSYLPGDNNCNLPIS